MHYSWYNLIILMIYMTNTGRDDLTPQMKCFPNLHGFISHSGMSENPDVHMFKSVFFSLSLDCKHDVRHANRSFTINHNSLQRVISWGPQWLQKIKWKGGKSTSMVMLRRIQMNCSELAVVKATNTHLAMKVLLLLLHHIAIRYYSD